ncbi:MAG: hypothetical protein J6M36_11915 [Prevotella sp.]|nr:hypothetical protein [Prevotella sp.]
MNTESFLKKDVLGRLCLRVAKTLPCLKSIDNRDIWNKPMELCQRIEENIREVDNVILEALKDSRYYGNSSTNPLNYQVLLTRVYILLYYRYGDDTLYKTIVFPELQKHMGIYNDKYLNSIQENINEIKKHDKLIEQINQEKKKNSRSKYSFIIVKDGEADDYFSEFNNELLFRNLATFLEGIKQQYFPRIDVASIWLTAKDVVRKLYHEKAPENFIDRIYRILYMNAGTGSAEYGAAEAVLLCAYTMMRTVKVSVHFNKVIQYIEAIPHQHGDYDLLYDNILSVKRYMDDGTISYDDYDYTAGIEESKETITKDDVEIIVRNYTAQIEKMGQQLKEKEQLLKEKECEIANYKSQSTTISQEDDIVDQKEQENMLYNKVSYEFILRLLEKSGFDINNTGNKTRAGELWHMLTGRSGDEFRRFCSQRNPINNYTKADVERLNNKLKEMGIDIQIEQ